MKSLKSTSALCAFFVLAALIVAGCGSSSSSSAPKVSSIPKTDVAIVAGNPITKRAVLHWMYIDAKGQATEEEGEPVIVPEDPPNFTNCIAQARKDIPELAKTKAATIRTECQSLFTSLSSSVMDFLIKSYWYQATAHKLGLGLTNAQLQTAIATAKKQGGITTATAYKEFLSTYGYTDADVSFKVLATSIYDKLLKQHPTTVTNAEIASYYAAHKSSYGSAEKFNAHIVLAKTAATASAAEAALKSGQSWDAVAKKYSTDPTTKNSGGLITGVTASEEDAALSKAALAAPLNKLEGPVKGQFGYYVFEVLKKTPATQKTLKQATAAIKKTLTTQKQTAAETAVNDMVAKQWKTQTVCTTLFAMDDCSNYVKPKTTASSTASATGTTPAPTVTSKSGGKSSAKSSTTSSSSSK
jgi:parvulin-like peptidyl-prolyl isomerase